MPLQTFRAAPDAPDFDEAAGFSFDEAPTYDEAPIDPDYDLVDPDYDEGIQGDFADDFRDSDSEEGSQEYQPRKQK